LPLQLLKGVGKWGAGEAEAPQILSSSYYVYKQLLQKDVQNVGKLKSEKNSIQVISSVTHTKIRA